MAAPNIVVNGIDLTKNAEHDLASLQAGVHPTTIGANAQGPTIDFGAVAVPADGPCFAIQHVGDLDDVGTLDGKIQESANGSSWSDISGATFTQVVAANNLQTLRFTRTMRYVRWAATVTGASVLFTVGVTIGKSNG